MSAKCIFVFAKHIAKLLTLSFSFLVIFCNSAHAVLINFDELNLNDYSYEEGNPYLTNEYESQGLVFKYSAYLLGWSASLPALSEPNYVGGPGFGLEFVGELPTFVSFYLGSSFGTAVFIDAQGPNYSKQITSSGEIHGMTDNYGTPYIPNQLFSFAASAGISSISFSGQGDAYIDDLTYTYASHASVPEPSAIILLAIGVLGLIFRANITNKN